MYNLTLQLYLQGQWRDAMRLSFEQPESGQDSPCSFSYEQAYLLDQLSQLERRTAQSVSATIPLSWELHRTRQWPAFLLDIVPSGAARRFLLARMAVPEGETVQADLQLLSRCTPAPIGHLRIKESVDALVSAPSMGFTREEVIARDTRFLEYAYEQGAAIGGATGAGGEAPKLLLAEDRNGLLHPDATLADDQVVQHWFVKFPRNKANQTDRIVLRSEYCFYQALNRLGIDTISSSGLSLEEAHKPSLWMKRFDRQVVEGVVIRQAVESIYSLAGIVRPGSYMSHVDAVAALNDAWTGAGQADEIQPLISDYLRRDLINQILGNSDNHGRNTSILRDEQRLRLAPIYDLAPMVMDDDGVTRTTKWPNEIERAGEVDWLAACQSLATWAAPEQLFETLRGDAQTLRALPEVLRDLALPEQTLNHPRIALNRLDATLKKWGLL